MKRKIEDTPENNKRIKISDPAIENFFNTLKEIYQKKIGNQDQPSVCDLSFEHLCGVLLEEDTSTLQAFYYALNTYLKLDSKEELNILIRHPLFLKNFSEALTPIRISCLIMIHHAFHDSNDKQVTSLRMLLENLCFFGDSADCLKNYSKYHGFKDMISTTKHYSKTLSTVSYPLHLFEQIKLLTSHPPVVFYKYTLTEFWYMILDTFAQGAQLKPFIDKYALWERKGILFDAKNFLNHQRFFPVFPNELRLKIITNLSDLMDKDAISSPLSGSIV